MLTPAQRLQRSPPMFRLQNRSGINNQARHHTAALNANAAKPHVRRGCSAMSPKGNLNLRLRAPF